MCTAVTYCTKGHYFGRTLDHTFSYQESVTITPRNFPLHFRRVRPLLSHYAMIGMARVVDQYPLYYDATNEKGLSIAGLNFPGNAYYGPIAEGKDNVAPFELIPWLLGQCATVAEARVCLCGLNLWQEDFSSLLPTTPLHWIIADQTEAITVESMHSGLRIYDNPVGVLTNSPPFDFMMQNLCSYRALSTGEPENHFSDQLTLEPHSRGMGALGLPGDLSSPSRFVKAAFTKLNAISGDSEKESVSQFFHILGAVSQQRGCVRLDDDQYEITIYTSCCNTTKGIYYYTTYENNQITGVDLHREDLDSRVPISYPLITEQQIRMQN